MRTGLRRVRRRCRHLGRGQYRGPPRASPANVAFGLGRLGRAVMLMTALGEELHGAMARAHLECLGGEVLDHRTGRPTATARAILDEHGEASCDLEIR